MDIADAPRGVLRHPAYLHFAASRVLSSLGFQGTAIALGWLLYDKTHNPFDLGLLGLCQFLPMVVLTFLVGHVADRFDRIVTVADISPHQPRTAARPTPISEMQTRVDAAPISAASR